MTKQDFELIASVLASERTFVEGDFLDQWRHVVGVFADELGVRFPRLFDRVRFIAACEAPV